MTQVLLAKKSVKFLQGKLQLRTSEKRNNEINAVDTYSRYKIMFVSTLVNFRL